MAIRSLKAQTRPRGAGTVPTGKPAAARHFSSTTSKGSSGVLPVTPTAQAPGGGLVGVPRGAGKGQVGLPDAADNATRGRLVGKASGLRPAARPSLVDNPKTNGPPVGIGTRSGR